MAKEKVPSVHLNELIDIVGLPISAPAVKAFMEAKGIKYPKKGTITVNKNNPCDREFWVEAKKLGIDLLFGIEVYNSKYTIEQGCRKGLFIPILTCVLFHDKASVNYPSDIHYQTTLSELTSKIGAPTSSGKSRNYPSDIPHKSILPELTSNIGSPTGSNKTRIYAYHLWELPMDPKRDVVFRLTYDINEHKICQMSIKIKELNPVIELYDTLVARTITGTALAKNSLHAKSDFFLINWALMNDLLTLPPSAQDSLDQFRSGKISIVEFIKLNFIDRGYIAEEDFVNIDPKFIIDYYANLSGHDIVYQRDFAFAFIKDETLRSNYLGYEAGAKIAKEALMKIDSALRKVDYTPESLGRVAEIIDQRYKEYTTHQFAQSTKIL